MFLNALLEVSKRGQVERMNRVVSQFPKLSIDVPEILDLWTEWNSELNKDDLFSALWPSDSV